VCPRKSSELDVTKAEDDRARKWSLRIAILSLILTTIFSAANFGYQVWRDRSTKKSTDARFGNIESVLRLLTGTVALQLQKAVDDSLVSAISANTRDDAKDKLIFASSAIRQLADAKVTLNPTGSIDMTRYLDRVAQVHQDLPETWRVIGDFISYRSETAETFEQSALPRCTDMPAKFSGTSKNGTKEGEVVITHGPFEFHDCKIPLDSPETTLDLSLNLSLSDVIFTRCAVFYRGGKIVVFPVKVARDTPAGIVGHASFKDCIFSFSFSRIPTPQGQRLALAVLESPPNDVQFEINTELSEVNQFPVHA
jgi:hypothetical protein